MTDQEKARQIEKAIKVLRGAASAFEHGRLSSGTRKLTEGLEVLLVVGREVSA
jgi:hypothetical protein